MINQVLQEMKMCKEPFSVRALSEKLNIEQSALEGVLLYWVRKGRLQESSNHEVNKEAGTVCVNCKKTCPGADQCSFVAKMPKMYSVSAKAFEVDTKSQHQIPRAK